jgi:hypothetical protein
LSKTEAGTYGKIVAKHLNGNGWSLATIKAVTAEADRLLGIKRGRRAPEFRTRSPQREARMSIAVMDQCFDSHGRRAS